MNESCNDSNKPPTPEPREVAADLELPVAPDWFSDPPKGSIEDGIQLSLLALEQIKDRPEIFAERDRQRCDVEFKM